MQTKHEYFGASTGAAPMYVTAQHAFGLRVHRTSLQRREGIVNSKGSIMACKSVVQEQPGT